LWRVYDCEELVGGYSNGPNMKHFHKP